MKQIYSDYEESIRENPEENREASAEVTQFLEDHNIIYHGNVIRTLAIPKIFTKTDVARFQNIVSTAYGIFEKIIREYLRNPEYRRWFPFSDAMKELILTPRLYDSLLPIARFDIFYNEDDGSFKFCEINTDGTSAMNEDRMMNRALIEENVTHQQMMKQHHFHSFELMDSWVRAFLQIYSTYQKKVPHPYVGIVDFLDGVEIAEFEEFARRFERAGVSCEICQITDLRYENHHLISPKGAVIDAVYRRVVTSDVMKRAAEIQPFLQAVKNNDVCIIGAFCTQIVHNKWLFKILHEKPTLSLLTEEEQAFIREHVPYTNLLDREYCDLEDIIAHKDKWLIKPLDSYASKGVFSGRDCSPEKWAALIHEYAGTGYIYQEYCPPYRTRNIDFTNGDGKFHEYTNMTGLYVYNGKFAGVYSRLSTGNIISSQYNERDDASVVIDC